MKIYYWFLVLLALNIGACASLLPEKVVDLDNTSLERSFEMKGLSKVIIFNDSNWLLYGFDNESGNIKIKIDGKEIGAIKTGKYLVAAIPKGKHQVELMHKDTMRFVSNHELEVASDIQFLKIAAEMTDNIAGTVSRPENFEKRYKLCCSQVVFHKADSTNNSDK